jgi:tetratricopeptide (TPR) repeat protein
MLRALLVAIVYTLFAFARAASAAEASELFSGGEQAFAAGDYREALRQFNEARQVGSSGPSIYYNIGVCQYMLRDYRAAERTFAELAAQFPAMRELAEYNRGLALRAQGESADARAAFERARSSSDEKVTALANAQLLQLGGSSAGADARWSGYLSGGIGYDDIVALIDELVLTSGSSSSPLVEALGVLTRDFGSVPLRVDASGYWVRYASADEFDQSALRVALVTEHDLGAWTLFAGPTLARTTLDGDGFEDLIGVDLRLRRSLGESLSFETRFIYDDADAGEARFAYLEGSRRQVRFALAHRGTGRARVGYDLESNDRADPGVSASRQRWSVTYQWQLPAQWAADAGFVHRKSRYRDATLPREERLLVLSFGARRDLQVGWTLAADYRWSDNDSTVDVFSYEAQRVSFGLSRSF